MSDAARWSKESPSEQGWYWYRHSNAYHPVPTFIEYCGDGRFWAVEVYERKMVYLTDVNVEWWPVKISLPAECVRIGTGNLDRLARAYFRSKPCPDCDEPTIYKYGAHECTLCNKRFDL